MAKLYFRYGAMNSGKSTALMQVAHNYEEQGMRVLILKPKVDTKGSGDLVSRLGVRRPADLLVPPDMDLVEAVRAASSEGRPLACVLCDESQFLTAEQAEQLFMVTVELNIPVICYGLRSDFSLTDEYALPSHHSQTNILSSHEAVYHARWNRQSAAGSYPGSAPRSGSASSSRSDYAYSESLA